MLQPRLSLYDLLYRSIHRLRQAITFAFVAAIAFVPAFALLGDWSNGLLYSLVVLLVFGSLAGAQEVAASRRRRRLRVFSKMSLLAGLFAAVWACLWILPFYAMIVMRHGHGMPLAQSIAMTLMIGASALLLSFLPESR